MALKPNFFQAIAALTLAFQAFKYIKRQAALLEKWDYNILGVRLMGVTKDFLDLQIELELKNPSAVSFSRTIAGVSLTKMGGESWETVEG